MQCLHSVCVLSICIQQSLSHLTSTIGGTQDYQYSFEYNLQVIILTNKVTSGLFTLGCFASLKPAYQFDRRIWQIWQIWRIWQIRQIWRFPKYPISAQIGLFGSVKSAKIMLYLERSNCRNGQILHLKKSNKSQSGLLKA